MPRSSSGGVGSTGRSRRPDRRHRGPASRHRRARGRRPSAPTARDGRGSRRRESCRARDSRPKVGFRPNMPQSEDGHPDRAVGVGAERERHQAGRDRRARAAGGAAGHPRRCVRVARGSVMDVLAGEVVGVLAHVEGADEHRAGSFQACDQRPSRAAGGRSRLIFEPARVGRPATSKRFLTANGTPASGPGVRRPRAASTAAARASARCPVTAVNALSGRRPRRCVQAPPRRPCRARSLRRHGPRRRSRRPTSRRDRPCLRPMNTGAGSASSGSGTATKRAAQR